MNRTLTKNEQILLTILIIMIILIVTFKFVLIPQASKLEELKEQKLDCEEEISQINILLKSERNIDREWMELHNEETIIHNKYFSTTNQPEIINLLNNILNDAGIDMLDMHFDKFNEEQIGDTIIKATNVNLSYKGNFENIISVIDGINFSPKKILISSLTMDKDADNKLVGNILLKVYVLEGIIKDIEEPSNIAEVVNGEKSNPFEVQDECIQKEITEDKEKTTDNYSSNTIENKKDVATSPKLPAPKETSSKKKKETSTEKKPEPSKEIEILEDFEKTDIYFVPSHENIKGYVSRSSNSKSNKYSLRLEYNILASSEEENRAYVDLTDKNIILKYPPTSIGLWVNSYSYSPSILGYVLKEQKGERIIEVELSKGISWIGWKYIESSPPQDISLYPLQLVKIYVESIKDKDDYGVLLIDGLEAKYPKSTENMEKFTFYIVEPEDTLEKISVKNYGNSNKVDLIMKYNEIKSDEDIWVGKILVIPK